MNEIIHILHLLAATTWAGGNLFFALILLPAMARSPAAEASALFDRIGPASGLVMGVSGVLVLVTGPLRAWSGGGIPSFGALGSPYGLWVIAAFVIVVAVSGFDGAGRARLRRSFDDPSTYPTVAGGIARRTAWVTAGGMTLLILIMALLGLGLY
ncbi:hypothetical protein [Maritimibacter alexandrii]|uniref:hypothetical protein n=1 Tax=Maritimibacter alexandrii TaxID=2570355 RepID=UPI001109A112|nr:hypothetical protein [Maritimibacter alexandrii]